MLCALIIGSYFHAHSCLVSDWASKARFRPSKVSLPKSPAILPTFMIFHEILMVSQYDRLGIYSEYLHKLIQRRATLAKKLCSV